MALLNCPAYEVRYFATVKVNSVACAGKIFTFAKKYLFQNLLEGSRTRILFQAEPYKDSKYNFSSSIPHTFPRDYIALFIFNLKLIKLSTINCTPNKMPLPPWIASTIAIGVTSVLLARVDYTMFFMKFFRDLSRSKARARLHGNKYALIPMMLGIEEPIKIQDDIDAENRMTVTREQLEEMDGFDGAPLYLSIKGRVYDVSAGAKFYGEGKEYHDWIGKDASRSFGMGCRGGLDRMGHECLSESLEGLNEKVSDFV